MNIARYLIISKGSKKWNPHVKIVSSLKGSMPSNSVAIRMSLQLPDTIFDKPQFEATIKIKDEDITKPVIDAETLDNIKQVFQQQLGVDMTIQVVTKDKKKG